MFKDIGGVFEKKKANLTKFLDKDKEIKESLKSFLEQEFGADLKGFSFVIRYNSKDNSLTITPDNKILANELTMKLVSLSDFLNRRKINLSRIHIR